MGSTFLTKYLMDFTDIEMLELDDGIYTLSYSHKNSVTSCNN